MHVFARERMETFYPEAYIYKIIAHLPHLTICPQGFYWSHNFNKTNFVHYSAFLYPLHVICSVLWVLEYLANEPYGHIRTCVDLIWQRSIQEQRSRLAYDQSFLQRVHVPFEYSTGRINSLLYMSRKCLNKSTKESTTLLYEYSTLTDNQIFIK